MNEEDLISFVLVLIIAIFVSGYQAGNEQVQKQYLSQKEQVIYNQSLPLTYTYSF